MKKECRKMAKETEMVRILVVVENMKCLWSSTLSQAQLYVVFIFAITCDILLPEKGHLHQI